MFYGTDTGNTERVAKKIEELLEQGFGPGTVDLLEIYKKKKDDMAKYQLLILGMPTWYDGELQGDWKNISRKCNRLILRVKK